MPLARYFFWIGSALLALLLIADACFPKSTTVQTNEDASPVLIRIHSVQKWPERVVLDTSAPMPRMIADTSPLQTDPALAAAAASDHARNALAQMQTSDAAPSQAAGAKRQEAARHRQRVATRRVTRPVYQQPQYAWFGGRMWW